MCLIIEEFTDNQISEIIKKLVNQDHWYLCYGRSDSNNLVKYRLCTGKDFYYMGENGNFISLNNNDFKPKDIVYFKE